MFGRLPRDQVLDYVANFDLALYPRTADQGIQAAKVAEYMGLGVPTVSYDFEVTSVLRETGAGVLVGEPREFVDAVVRLAGDVAVPAVRSPRPRAAQGASSTGKCSRAGTRRRSSIGTFQHGNERTRQLSRTLEGPAAMAGRVLRR